MLRRAQGKMRKIQPTASLPYFLNDGLFIARVFKYVSKLWRIETIRSVDVLGTRDGSRILTLKHL